MTQKAHDLYSNIPIERSDMRIIELCPGQFQDEIVCRLFVRPIDPDRFNRLEERKPQSHIDWRSRGYNALSYAWGNPKPVSDIICNDLPWTVAKNLHSALLHLRSAHNVTYLWIDALCLNQYDVSERNVQLRNIGQIYENADHVAIWLGESSHERIIDGIRLPNGTEDAFKLANELGRLIDVEPKIGRLELVQVIRGIFVSRERLQKAISTLIMLGSRPWFGRIWVRQELGRARFPTVVCGFYSMDWNAFIVSLKWLQSMSREHGQEFRESGQSLSGLAAGTARKGHQLELLDLLIQNRCAKATIPHDKIYAVMGMASDPYVDQLEAEYQKPMQEVFESLVKFVINRDGCLDIIYASESPDHAEMDVADVLPSWVPDWRFPSLSSDILLNRRGMEFCDSNTMKSRRTRGQPRKFRPVAYDTIGHNQTYQTHDTLWRQPTAVASIMSPTLEDHSDLKPRWDYLTTEDRIRLKRGVFHEPRKSLATYQYRQELGSLRVQGFEWDRILVVVEVCDSQWAKDVLRSSPIHTQSGLSQASRREGDLEPWRSMYMSWAGRLYEQGQSEVAEVDKMSWEVFLSDLVAPILTWHDGGWSKNANVMDYLQEGSKAQKAIDPRKMQLQDFVERLTNRKVCTTAKGHRAIVPLNSKEKEWIFILHGGQLPCVLRPMPSHEDPLDSSLDSSSTTSSPTGLSQVSAVGSFDPNCRRFQFLGGCFVAGADHASDLENYLINNVKAEDILLV